MSNFSLYDSIRIMMLEIQTLKKQVAQLSYENSCLKSENDNFLFNQDSNKTNNEIMHPILIVNVTQHKVKLNGSIATHAFHPNEQITKFEENTKKFDNQSKIIRYFLKEIIFRSKNHERTLKRKFQKIYKIGPVLYYQCIKYSYKYRKKRKKKF